MPASVYLVSGFMVLLMNILVRRGVLLITLPLAGITARLRFCNYTRAVPGIPTEQDLTGAIFLSRGKNTNKDVKNTKSALKRKLKELRARLLLINHGIFLMFNG